MTLPHCRSLQYNKAAIGPMLATHARNSGPTIHTGAVCLRQTRLAELRRGAQATREFIATRAERLNRKHTVNGNPIADRVDAIRHAEKQVVARSR